MSGRIVHAIVRFLDGVAPEPDPREDEPEHLRTGRRGEEDAYFYLRRRGYTLIAANYRSPHCRGEIDLVGWHQDVLCFIEVKTRTTRAVKPAEGAVDENKQKELRLVARDFLRHLTGSGAGPQLRRGGGCGRERSGPGGEVKRDGPQCRFDVVSIYYDRGFANPSFELFQNAFPVAYNRGFANSR
jgi:putative endonuclease